MIEPTFLQVYFFIEYCCLTCNIVVSLAMLLAALIYLKPKVLQLFPILHYFLIQVFSYGQSVGCIVLS